MSNYSIICSIISIKAIFSSIISSLVSICSNIGVIIGIFRRDIAHLSENVVLLDSCKQHKIQLIAQRFQVFEWEIPLLPCPMYCQPSMCILLTTLVWNVQVYYRMKNKPILNIRGV